MTLPDSPLESDLLYLFVLGPGTGETVLLRVPPDEWIIIDSFANGGRPAADAIIADYGGSVVAVILTHPHQDHCGGFIELLDDHPDATIGCVHPRDGTTGPTVPADPIALLHQRAKPTYDRIWQEWQANGNRKWETFRAESLDVGGGTLASLHPTRPLAARDWTGASPNDMSSAMRFEWGDVKLLLGADVTNTSWPDIATNYADLADHHAMKVPHHASSEAIHSSYGNGARNRKWIATPFARQRLPRTNDDNGIAKALLHVDAINLTSLPFSHDKESDGPCKTTRTEINRNARPKKTGPVTTDPAARARRYVALAYDKSATLQGQWHGDGSVLVSE